MAAIFIDFVCLFWKCMLLRCCQMLAGFSIACHTKEHYRHAAYLNAFKMIGELWTLWQISSALLRLSHSLYMLSHIWKQRDDKHGSLFPDWIWDAEQIRGSTSPVIYGRPGKGANALWPSLSHFIPGATELVWMKSLICIPGSSCTTTS